MCACVRACVRACVCVSTSFDVFEPASLSDVEKIALASATKSCELDPLPTSLVKHYIDALSPLLARIINASLSSTIFPAPMKHAVVVPALKKGGSDASVLTNYRPISNITFVAKMTERFVAFFFSYNTLWRRSESTAYIKVHIVRIIVRKPHSCAYTTTSPNRLTVAGVCSSCYSI